MLKNKLVKGISYYEVETWDELKQLFDGVFSKGLNYVFRGHTKDDWKLEPTITRLLNDESLFDRTMLHSRRITIERHYDQFKSAILGRRGVNPPKLDQMEVWALGQHHGLATPLLDWTRSPYVATFFAFRKHRETGAAKEKAKRAIWVLETHAFEITSKNFQRLLDEDGDLKKNRFGEPRGIIELVISDNDENQRLVTQSGVFTYVPVGSSIEQWAEKNTGNTWLTKIVIPDNERNTILRGLDQMNINDATLFPDVTGAAQYCNYMLEVHGNGSRNSTIKRGVITIGFDLEDLPD